MPAAVIDTLITTVSCRGRLHCRGRSCFSCDMFIAGGRPCFSYVSQRHRHSPRSLGVPAVDFGPENSNTRISRSHSRAQRLWGLFPGDYNEGSCCEHNKKSVFSGPLRFSSSGSGISNSFITVRRCRRRDSRRPSTTSSRTQESCGHHGRSENQ